MKKSKLEIITREDIGKNKLKEYKWVYEWRTPYIKISKNNGCYKFDNKMEKFTRKMGRKIQADLAIIESTNKYRPDNTASRRITFYREK